MSKCLLTFIVELQNPSWFLSTWDRTGVSQKMGKQSKKYQILCCKFKRNGLLGSLLEKV